MDNSQPKSSIDSLQSSDMQSSSVLKILIVDDAESDRVSYLRYLQSDSERSYQIIEAKTLEDGLELWRSQQPDIVLLDINLPDGDGLEFLEAINTDQLISKLPVIMLTGQGDERIAVRAMKLGAADYLVKNDVTSVSLLTCVNQVLENNLLLRQLRRSQQQQMVIASMALHIRRSIVFEDVANAIVQEVRSFLDADRTIIYRFNSDMSGTIVAEAVDPPWEPCLDVQIEDTCFRENLGGEYRNGKVFAANDIYGINLTECHIQLLERFQVRANLVVPILLNGTNTLWGLLIVHQCSAPRQWHEEDIQLLHQLSVHLAIVLQQAELYQNLRTMNSSLEEKVQERTTELQLQTKVLEEIHDAAITTDLNGTILSWNHGAEQLYEYKSEEMLGQNIALIYEDPASLQTAVIEPLLAKVRHSVEVTVLAKSGKRIHISLRLSVVKNEQGNITHLIGCANDISDRKLAEQELQQLNQDLEAKVEERTTELQRLSERLALALKSGAFGCWEWDLVQNTKFWDERMYELYGTTKKADVSPNYEDWVNRLHPEDRNSTEILLQQAVLGEAEYDTAFRVLHPDGTIHFIKAYGVVVRDAQGNPKTMIGINFDISDRKQAEQEILGNQRFIQQIADSSPNVLYLYDIQEQRNTYANREILASLGYTATEIQEMGASWLPTVIHPDDLLPTSEHFERLKMAEDGEVFSNEYRFRHANGEWRYFYSRDLIFSRDAQGQVKLIIGTAQDITDRKITEAALRASDQRWQFALESAGDGIWDWNVETNAVFFSEQWKAMLGYADDEIENSFESWENIVHPDDLAQCYEDISKCLNCEMLLYENEHRLRCKDGSYKWILARGRVFEWDADGHPLRMMGTHTDLSDRKRIALEFQQLSERLTLALRSGAIGCWDWNSTDNSLYWDDRMYEIYGITKKSDARLTYDIWANALHPEDRAVAETLVQQASFRIVEFDTEFRIVRPDGEIGFIKAYGVGIPDIYGNIQTMIGINFDISDRKQAEAQLQQMNEALLRATRLKDEFLANMSHELRTPLNAILGLSNALGEQLFGALNERQIKAIAIVESSGEHLLSLINDILDLSKIASGMMELNIESVSVSILCGSSLVFVKQQAFQKKVQIVSNIPKNINNINVEERRIRQVLINLLTNAVKFTPSAGQISLLVAVGKGDDPWQGEATIPQQLRMQNSPMIVFQIVDTGIGIAANDLQRLFQPFVQVDSALNRQYEGTGLGLALVKQIVELHGGQVMAESEVGKGSRFTFALPYEMALSASEVGPTPLALSPLSINPDNAIAPLILLVEDNEANVQTFTSYLIAINYRVLVARNGGEAIAMAKSESPDIILMDIQMPEMDGLAAIRLIRADESIAAIPIIALTALAMEGDRERCLAAGANEYLAKPVKFRQLNTMIQQVLVSR